MGLRINTNIFSINARRNLETHSARLGKSFQRLSTGLRITSAADDAAGLAISERLRSQTRSLEQASRNANDGISVIQTAEGALDEVNNILTRLRELSIQSANGTYTNTDRDTLQEEFSALVEEVDRIAASTEFNGTNLFQSQTVISFQVGAGTTTSDSIDVTFTATSASGLGLDTLSIGSGGDVSGAIAAIDTAVNSVSDVRGQLGAANNRLTSTISNLSVRIENTAAAESRIRDVDVAAETANLTKNSILQQAALSILSQANVQPQAALSLLG